MRRWSEVAERVAATTRTSEKTALLADYLHGLHATDLQIASVFFTGRPFPEADQRSTGLGWSAIASAVIRTAGVAPDAIGRAYDRSSDLGQAVAEVLEMRPSQPPHESNPSVADVAGVLAAIESSSGGAAKGALFEALLARSDALTGK